MASPAYVRLLDLPPDLLARIGAQLTFEERLRLSLVCRRWRDVCAGPSELWSTVDACIRRHTYSQGSWHPFIPEFVRWFTRRAHAVEELRLEVKTPAFASVGIRNPVPVPAGLLHDGSGPRLPLPLRKLALSYRGSAILDFGGGAVDPSEWLPALQKVALLGCVLMQAPVPLQQAAQHAPGRLTDLGVVGDSTRLPGAIEATWLPPSLTALMISGSACTQLPRSLARLQHIRSLVVDNNSLSYDTAQQGIRSLAQPELLEELNLSSNELERPPSQLTALRRLRILYLAGICGHPDEEARAEDWEPLRACTVLAFLSISSNMLELLPPAVADMTHLQALHCEENNMPSLPVAPYLSSLRELLVDWRTLMARPVFLRAATQLTRLILHRFEPWVPPGGEPGAGEALLAELATMPALRRVDDVLNEGASTHKVTTEQAHVMWQLGKRCPHLQFEQPRSTNLGWTLTSLVAELPHNAGTTVLEG